MEIITQTTQYQSTPINAQIEQSEYISPKQGGFFDVKEKLQEIISNFVSREEKTIDDMLNDEFLDLDFGAEFDIDAAKIGLNDAVFFVNLLNQEELINYSLQDNKLTISDFEGKKINATSSLLNMLQTSLDSKKPIRLDFENNITVVLKLDKDGKIQAHFIPGNAEVESYLKNNILSLKQRFDDQQINYSHLGYTKYKDENKDQKKNKKG